MERFAATSRGGFSCEMHYDLLEVTQREEKILGGNNMITIESIDGIKDDDLEFELFDYIIDEIICEDYENQYELITNLPDGLKYFYVSWQLEAEVNNGGFNQYFYNTSGEFIDEAIEAFKYFELVKLAEIVTKAAEIAVDEIELHIKTKRIGTLEAFSNSYKFTNLGEADCEFYKYGSDISQARIKKIRSYTNDFILKR
ncbi:MAG: DMP19 family protein [Clostridia bacterium]|nr:DMP19 family protein [Clostridia bacterium]